MNDERLAAVLAAWLPGRRWFAGRGRAVTGIRIERRMSLPGLPDGDRAELAVVRVEFDDGPAQRYQVPLTFQAQRPAGLAPGSVLSEADEVVVDGAADPATMTAVLRLVAGGERYGQLWAEAHASAVPDAGDPRLLGGEQSNTSVVFGDRVILKLFRRLWPGVNPDVEVRRALRPARLDQVGELFGELSTELDGEPVTLAMVSSFLPEAQEGWSLAIGAAAGGPESAQLPADHLHGLGAVVAGLHIALGATLGTTSLTGTALAGFRGAMTSRLAEVERRVPALAPYAPAVRSAFAALDRPPPGERLQRVHGDLHLGQVLRDGSSWRVIDFEGEPTVPIAERVTRRSGLQDVAGMLRSLDYVAATLERVADPETAVAARRWERRARAAFLAGYAEGTGVDLAARQTLLRACELDKAVYEVAYEAAHRPEWTPIPLGGLERALVAEARRDAG